MFRQTEPRYTAPFRLKHEAWLESAWRLTIFGPLPRPHKGAFQPAICTGRGDPSRRVPDNLGTVGVSATSHLTDYSQCKRSNQQQFTCPWETGGESRSAAQAGAEDRCCEDSDSCLACLFADFKVSMPACFIPSFCIYPIRRPVPNTVAAVRVPEQVEEQCPGLWTTDLLRTTEAGVMSWPSSLGRKAQSPELEAEFHSQCC